MMRLEDYRQEQGLTYEGLGRALELSTAKAYRLCTDINSQEKIMLKEAAQIVDKTGGAVTLDDLRVEADC